MPAPTGPESAAFDQRAIESLGVAQPVLMENAGRAAAQILAELFPQGRVAVMVGAGNNGGDALVLARTLLSWGRDVTTVLVADRPLEEPLLHGWPLSRLDDTALGEGRAGGGGVLESAAVVVDGILGTGTRGAPRERQARAIARVNRCGRPVLALDVPSGVDATTGAVPGEAVRAVVTVAFGAPKLGSLLHPARALTGRLVAVEIGFPPWAAADAAAAVATPSWARARLPVRHTDTHKNAVGRVLVVGGRRGMAGAVVLSARAAMRAGAGLVQVCSPPENREVLQAAVPEAIFVDPDDAGALEAALSAARAIALGPGLGTTAEAAMLLRRVLAGPPVAAVIDADALNLLAHGRAAQLPTALRGRPALLTPHPGEMARLRGVSPADIATDRVGFARGAASEYGCTVLLKGAPSLVASPNRRVLVDAQGSSDLAVAGMGDVLTGTCASLLAQGLEPRDAGAVGLYLSGRAATLAGRGAGLSPTDVVRWLPHARSETTAPSTSFDLPFVLFDHDPAR